MDKQHALDAEPRPAHDQVGKASLGASIGRPSRAWRGAAGMNQAVGLVAVLR
jgi:hypothetical protein